ncbi:MAG TPA: hypothetical protein VL284_20930 [Thermoanaerobaculia bacterium]|nr:hypothetical protein [Thermoanaerobaculia bacterium]
MKTLVIAMAAVSMCFGAFASTDVRHGVWAANLENGRLEVTIFHGKEKRQSVSSFDEPVSAFAGLSQADLTGTGSNVQFELRRAAGTIAFEGRVADSAGAGHYTFVPSDTFIGEMASLGYREFKDEMLLIFAINDFSPQTLRGLRAMGYQPTQHEVEEIAIFRITPDFLREIAAAGYPDLSLRDAVNFRVGRVDAAYINDMRALGYTNLTAHQLADGAILGVSPAYVRELNAAGLSDLTAKQLTDLRVGRVSAARIEEYRKLGYDKLTAHQLSEMGIFGVTPEYIRDLSAKGYNAVPVEKLLRLREMGADRILFK